MSSAESKDNIRIVVRETKIGSGDAAISIGFKSNASGCCLCKMLSQTTHECRPEGTEEMLICYSMYMFVNQALSGNPLAVSKSKVASVNCVAGNGQFSITWNTKGNLSAVRKSVGIALKVMNPAKMYSVYSKLAKDQGIAPIKEVFNYVAEKVRAAMASELLIMVVGPVKSDPAKLKDLLGVLANKKNLSAIDGEKKKPTDYVECNHQNYTVLKSKGWQAAIMSDFLRERIRGLNPIMCDDSLLLNIKPQTWESLSKKLKEHTNDFVKAKYSKLGDTLGVPLAYVYSRVVPVYDLLELSNIKLQDVIKALNI